MRAPLKFAPVFLLIFFSIPAFSQLKLNGRVLSTETNEAIAFATVSGPNKTGVIADIDGNFELVIRELPCSLKINSLGYETQIVEVTEVENLLKIKLQPSKNQQNEVIITPTDNPAWRIIRLASKNRDQNNPEKNHRFSYNSYSKMFLTAGSVNKDGALIDAAADTSMDKEVRQILERSYLLFSETYSNRVHLSEKLDKETILATKISGFKSPAFGMLASQMQSFSFYGDLIAINNKHYLNPLTSNSENHYRFELVDTAYNNADTVFIITYTPRRGKNFDALEGKIYINSNGYAVQNVVAEPVVKVDGQLHARIQQQYRQISGVWFPEQLNTFLSMTPSKQDKSAAVVGEARSYISNVQLNPDIEKKEAKGIASDIIPEAGKRDSTYWTDKRSSPLSTKEQNTYFFIDSLSVKEKLEQKFNLITYLIDGQIPFGPVGLVLNDIMKVNKVEGFRLGIGLRTNDRLSRYFSVGGAIGYGFKDKRYKYRGDLSVYLIKDQKLTLNAVYKNDLIEPGRADFDVSKLGITASEQFRKVFVNRMDQIELKQVSIKSRIGNSLTVEPFFNQQLRVISGYDYRFVQPIANDVSVLRDHFLINQVGLNVRLAVGEKFARVFNRVLPQGPTKYPLIQASLSRSADLEYKGNNFNRIEAQLGHQVRIKLAGEINYRLNAGYVDNVAPYPFLFNPKGNGNGGNLGINAFGSFETMRFNEFVANRYAAAFLYYDLKSLLFKSKKFAPGVVVSGNAIIGNLSNRDAHRLSDVQVPDRVYTESGLMLTNLLKSGISSLGIGFFYRMGHYAFPEFKDNYAVKLNVNFNLD